MPLSVTNLEVKVKRNLELNQDLDQTAAKVNYQAKQEERQVQCY